MPKEEKMMDTVKQAIKMLSESIMSSKKKLTLTAKKKPTLTAKKKPVMSVKRRSTLKRKMK